MELDKTMEIEFSNLFLQYFQNISKLWKRSIFFDQVQSSFASVANWNPSHGKSLFTNYPCGRGYNYSSAYLYWLLFLFTKKHVIRISDFNCEKAH